MGDPSIPATSILERMKRGKAKLMICHRLDGL
jgi:hypothetical protein